MQVVYILFILLSIEETYFAQASSLIPPRYKRQACGKDQFTCRNGQCVPTVGVCDGATDCSDGSDETRTVCTSLNIRCPSFVFRCAYGACIDKENICDGKKDCADNSDELLPDCPNLDAPIKDNSCNRGEFKCTSGQCVDEFSLCDGVADCNDGSDETITQCVNIKCPPVSFQCAYGACINNDKKCNNVNDCADASDEDEDLCRSEKKPGGTNIPKPSPSPMTVQPTVSPTTRCSPDFSFQCAYGSCIDKAKKCNNVNDCSDASDEDEELCRSEKKPGTNIPKLKPSPSPPTVPTATVPPTTREGCVLPDFPEGGHYLIETCSIPGRCNGSPGEIVPSSSIIKYECYKGYVLSNIAKSDNPFVFCKINAWNSKLHCLKQCKALVSDSMEFHCSFRGRSVKCNQPLNPGTKVQPTCKTAYKKVHTSDSYIETRCLGSGILENALFRCEAECGKRNRNLEVPLIGHGNDTGVGEYPWHAGLYRKEKDGFKYICGGTIISPYAILTAAHCIYIEQTETVLDKNDLKVAVGKYRRSWAVKDKYEKRYDVREIIPEKYYRGKINNYFHDIAVLDLTVSIEISQLILPACLDWQNEAIFYKGMPGTAIGWGLNEDGVFSETLQMVELPYFDYYSCINEFRKEFQPFITYDKFCAGYKNSTGVDQGDSGGGFIFEMGGLYFVQGVVSLKEKGQATYALFTNVSTHYQWLNGVLNALRPHHSN